MSGKLRIIGGEWRSRQITFDDAPGLRPTPARVRETLFNWLQLDVANSRCLDLFAGSGALGFEAASRGARAVVQVESNPATCNKLMENIALLNAKQISVERMDVQRYLQVCNQQFDLVFLDPPFALDLIRPVCRQLLEGKVMAPKAKIYVEAERNFQFEQMPAEWRLLKHKTAGEVGFGLFQLG